MTIPAEAAHGERCCAGAAQVARGGEGRRVSGSLPSVRAPVAQWIEQRFPKPRALVRFRPEAWVAESERMSPAASSTVTVPVVSELPLDRPGKIVCVGLNYHDHAEEQGTEAPSVPLLFAKWPSALIGSGDPIVIPHITKQVDYEAELAVVIGERIRGVSQENALEAVRGYTCLNDV